jgi:hypothetical protein
VKQNTSPPQLLSAKECCWCGAEELQNKGVELFKLKIHNKATIALSKNLVFHKCRKHIDKWYHFIRDYIDQGKAKIIYINTSTQLADILMKALGRIKFQ